MSRPSVDAALLVVFLLAPAQSARGRGALSIAIIIGGAMVESTGLVLLIPVLQLLTDREGLVSLWFAEWHRDNLLLLLHAAFLLAPGRAHGDAQARESGPIRPCSGDAGGAAAALRMRPSVIPLMLRRSIPAATVPAHGSRRRAHALQDPVSCIGIRLDHRPQATTGRPAAVSAKRGA